MRNHENESPALQRGAFDSNQNQRQPVGNTYSVGARSEQLAAEEDFIDKMIPCFAGYCALQACRVCEGDLDLPMAGEMAKRLADYTGLTLAIGVKDMETMLTREFLDALGKADSGSLNQAAAREAYGRQLLAAFDAYCTAIVWHVRTGKITIRGAADAAHDFADSNGLIQMVGKDRVQRIMAKAFANARREAA